LRWARAERRESFRFAKSVCAARAPARRLTRCRTLFRVAGVDRLDVRPFSVKDFFEFSQPRDRGSRGVVHSFWKRTKFDPSIGPPHLQVTVLGCPRGKGAVRAHATVQQAGANTRPLDSHAALAAGDAVAIHGEGSLSEGSPSAGSTLSVAEWAASSMALVRPRMFLRKASWRSMIASKAALSSE